MHNLKELKIWHKAIELSTEIYEVSKEFPKEEQYGLTIQLRRAVVSVASNIAEGAGRNSDKEFIQFLSIAYGSLFEIQTQVIIAQKLKYLEEHLTTALLDKIDELQKMTFQFRKNIKIKIRNQ